MFSKNSSDDIIVTAETLIQMAEAEIKAEGGCLISPEARDVLTRAVTRDLSVPFGQKGMSDADYVAKIKTQMRVIADGLIAIVDKESSGPVAPQRSTTTQERNAERIKGKRKLSDALAEQRQQSEVAWNAATVKMRTAWVPGPAGDRRVIVTRHEPERRRH